MGKCKVRPDWLNKTDAQGLKISSWGSIASESTLFCKVCTSTISVRSGGFQAISNHYKAESHKNEARIKLNPNQLRFAVNPETGGEEPTSSTGSNQNRPDPNTFQLYSTKDSCTAAELIWCLKVVANDYSLSSCSGLPNTFHKMFDCPTAKRFTMSPTKSMYYIAEALGPYFKDEQKKAMEGKPFSMSYDETTNETGHQELQVGVRYWSDGQGGIVCEHLETFYLDSAKAVDIKTKLYEALNNASLPTINWVQMAADGPNVNKSVRNLINEDLKISRQKTLFDVGSCSLHNVHNGFKKGLEELGMNISTLILDTHAFFDGWPSRWEKYHQIQKRLGVAQHRFIKHCTGRFLTLGPAAKRFLEQWDAITEYILNYIPNDKTSKLKESKTYLRITNALKDVTMKAELHFVISVAAVYENFSAMFQTEKPLIHVLHDGVKTLLTTLIGRTCKSSTVSSDAFRVDNLAKFEDMNVGDGTRKALLDSKATEKQQTLFLKSAQEHYRLASIYILQKFPLTTLKSFECLQPAKRRSAESCKDIVRLAKAMPWKIPEDRLLDEWKLLQTEEDKNATEGIPIDTYWAQFFEKRCASGLKYPTVKTLVSALLTIYHGNADVERGFSTSGRIITPDRASMSCRTLNAILNVKAALRRYNNDPHLIPITQQLIKQARCAYRMCNDHLSETKKAAEEAARKEQLDAAKLLEEEKNRRAEEERSRNVREDRKLLKEKEEEMKKFRRKESEAMAKADNLFEEASRRLKKAIEKKDMTEIGLAQAMLAGVTAMRSEAKNARKAATSVEKYIDKKRKLQNETETSAPKRKS